MKLILVFNRESFNLGIPPVHPATSRDFPSYFIFSHMDVLKRLSLAEMTISAELSQETDLKKRKVLLLKQVSLLKKMRQKLKSPVRVPGRIPEKKEIICNN